MARTYQVRCGICGTATTSRLRPRPELRVSCQADECLRATAAAHNAAVAEYHRAMAERPARAAAPRERVAYGDYAQLVAFMGNPGGRKAARTSPVRAATPDTSPDKE